MELNRDKGEEFVRETQTPESATAWKKQLDEFAPGASDWVVEAVFGGTYQRDGITLRDRQMLNMAALAAMGGVEPQTHRPHQDRCGRRRHEPRGGGRMLRTPHALRRRAEDFGRDALHEGRPRGLMLPG